MEGKLKLELRTCCHAADCPLPSACGIIAHGIARQGDATVAVSEVVPSADDHAGDRGDAESAGEGEEGRDSDGAVRWKRTGYGSGDRAGAAGGTGDGGV